MQGIMCVDDVELDPSLFQIPTSPIPLLAGHNIVDVTASRSAQTVAVVELGKQLLLAAKDGQVDMVRDLMSRGAPFTTDWLGVSPLHLAVQSNHVETAEVLLRAGISQEARTKVDRTPLHMAAQGGHLDSVRLLLRHGAEINCCDMLRMTPLHWAVQNQNIEVIETLLQGGADPHAVSKFEKTPVSMAKDLGRSDIVDILENADYANIMPASLQSTSELDQESLAATASIAGELTTDHHEITQQIQAAPPSPKKPRIRIQMESKQVMVTLPPTATSRTISYSKVQTPKRISSTSSGVGVKTSFEAESSPLSTFKTPVTSTPVNNSTFQLLQAHGITMLPNDESTTVESAMESGQTVVLTEAGKMALNLTRVGGRLIGVPKGKTIHNVTSGGVQKRTPVLGSNSRIIKIHPSQLVALGGGRTNQTQQIPQLLQQKQKGSLQHIQIHQEEQNELPQLGEEGMVESIEEDYEETPIPTDLESIAQELANARKQAAEFRKQLAKKEKEAELYLQQLRTMKSIAQ